jgi:hypothetical protein
MSTRTVSHGTFVIDGAASCEQGTRGLVDSLARYLQS